MRSHFSTCLLSRIMVAAFIFVLLSGCEIDPWGDTEKSVTVTVNITLTNGYTKDAYLIVTDLYEQNGPSTLVKPGASRTAQYGMNVLSDPLFEHTFDIMLRGESDQGAFVLVHTVDHTKYSIGSVDSENLDLGYKSINVRAVFTGTSFTVTESQGS
ncbi:MAG: hypothetical protein WC395_09175 [Bacteroidales bacterium]